jgi:trehalose 6-phosphate phosphatase
MRTPSAATDIGPPPIDLLQGACLFLDFDGTLVELAPRPDAVFVDEALRGLMRRLVDRLGSRLAIVSGRPIGQIADFLGDLCPAVSGSHGLELLWPDGRHDTPPRPAWLGRAVADATRFAAAHPGVVVEDKPLGVALHWRQAPDAEAACLALAGGIVAGGGEGMLVQPGKMMIELRPSGGDKGSAVRRFMQDVAMRDGMPVFIGDDVTDESAFAAATELGGYGILVGPPRETHAAFRLADVAATRAWLDRAIGGVR